jgi:hypothetical protein
MALVSPGVQVSVIDQSNYAPTSNGSVAYVLLATAQDKIAPGGTTIASGTLAENAGKVYNITSQRDLVTTFGTPIFKTTAGGAPINGDEQNEYGLLAAYSALGVSNTMYVQRANIDLASINGTTTRPLSNPDNGSFWLDTANTNWGVYEWNASTQSFAQKAVTVITSTAQLTGNIPNVSTGSIGDYAVNTLLDTNPIFHKRYDNTWQLVGNVNWQAGVPTITGSVANATISANANITVNGTNVTVATGANLTTVIDAINTAAITGVTARLSSAYQIIVTATQAATNGAVAISNGNNTPLTDLGITAGTYLGAVANAAPYYNIPEWQSSNLAANLGRPTGSVWQKASAIGSGLNIAVKEYNSSSSSWDAKTVGDYTSLFAASYGLDPTGGGTNIQQDVVVAIYASSTGSTTTFGEVLYRRKNAGALTVTGSTSSPVAANVGAVFNVTTRASTTSATTTTYNVTIATSSINGFISAVSAANIPNVTAGQLSTGEVTLTHALGGEMFVKDLVGTALANVGITTSATNVYASPVTGDTTLLCTNFEPLSVGGYTTSATQPFVAPSNDVYWYYNTPSRVDVMINTGSGWAGYGNVAADIRGYNLTQTNSTGPIISPTAPTTQDDGTALVYGDLWLDSVDLENYPKIYRWQSVTGIDQWVLIDTADAVSQNGLIFADARWATSGTVDPATDSIPTISALRASNYTDLDAPDATLYPRGILLFNTRASGYNVKQYKSAYFTSAAYPNETLPTEQATWVTVSGFSETGLPNFGRKAQRGVVVSALKSAIDSSTSLREDQNVFNLIVCPGYPELIPNMVALNSDKDNTSFVIADSPLRLPATGTDIQNWANNESGVTFTGEGGLNTISPYVGVYYPSGQTNDLNGNSVVVPASHALLRSIIKSDSIAYPWLAPAGTRRGLIDNLNAIGYIDADSGQFISIGVTQGLRDVMYTNKINPLTNLPGTGLVVYGQKTLSETPSSMDRINVARLVNYIRSQLNVLARPFLFEPNDPITRNAISAVVSSLLNDLVAKRGLTDYLVVCDGTNNTPERIARNELYVDVAIQPTKDVEFIYIPVRLKNPGEIQAGNLASATAVGTGA